MKTEGKKNGEKNNTDGQCRSFLKVKAYVRTAVAAVVLVGKKMKSVVT